MAKRKLFDVSTERHVAMKMRDGVELRADIHRPNVSDPLPVLLIRLPYDKSAAGFQACQLPEWY
ncbi:MAG: CocE/NonD family hydrolase, partial [Alphaproteobacteria bacterium]|nr:CocE/NonD family hydrolase [Alphaproteobacteria bacterium]